MKRIATALGIAVLFAAAFLLVPSLFAQKQSPDELLTKARNAINPSLAGPHHLEAQVTVLLADGKKGKGTYVLDWAAPDKFREEVHLPGYDEVKIASGKTLYIKRNADYVPLRAVELSDLMHPLNALENLQRHKLRLEQDAKLTRNSGDQASKEQFGGSTLAIGHALCVIDSPFMSEMCADAKNYWPLKIPVDVPEMDNMLVLDKYKKLDGIYIPRERRYFENDEVTVEAMLKGFSSVKQFDPATFAPPAGAEQIDWCSSLIPALRQPVKSMPVSSINDFPGPEMLYGLVGTDGSLRKFAVIESAGSKADTAIVNIAGLIRFQPATCDGKPVESETTFVISEMDFLSSMYGGKIPEAGKDGFTSPKCTFCPTPQFTDAAFNSHTEGHVILSVIIETDGRAHDVRILKRLGAGLDESALKAVRDQWRFEPAKGPDGKPAAVHTIVEVDFNIYGKAF